MLQNNANMRILERREARDDTKGKGDKNLKNYKGLAMDSSMDTFHKDNTG